MNPVREAILQMPLDLGLSRDSVIERLTGSGVLLSYLNPYAWKIARHHPDYMENLAAMDLVVCDGVMIRHAARRFLATEVEIMTPDYSGIGPAYLRAWQRVGGRVCLVGADAETLEAAKNRLLSEFSGINIVGAFPGYGNIVNEANSFILETGPDFVLAAMGMGLQEQFLVGLRKQGWKGTGVCAGAFFDRLARPRHDYPEWSKRLNMRFLGNLSRRPVYYLRRYAVDYLPFLEQYVRHLRGNANRPG